MNHRQLEIPDSLEPARREQMAQSHPLPPVPARPVWLYGFGGHAKVVADLLVNCDMKLAGVVDDDEQIVNQTKHAVRPGLRLDPDSAIFNHSQPMVLCVGNNRSRASLARELPNYFVSPRHPSAIISPTVSIGVGTVIMQGAIVQAEARLGDHVIINSGASIDHDNQIGDFVHVSPRATLCGHVTVGEGSWIGAGAVVIQGVTIGKWATVGAGAVVIRDVPDYATVVGNPAREIKTSQPEDLEAASKLRDDQNQKQSSASVNMNPRLSNQLLVIINQVLASSQRPLVSEFSPESRLQQDLGLDSLELAELTVRIEAETGVDVFRDGLVRTVGEVVKRLSRSS